MIMRHAEAMGMEIEAPTKCSATVEMLPTIADHNGSD
jgi:hypothetical protein